MKKSILAAALVAAMSCTAVEEQGLIVNRVADADDKWDAQTRRHLTYCVSDAFGTR